MIQAPAQQAGPLDVPVFVDSASGVTLRRPWDDWVFEPARSRGTLTVIFHPRDGSLSDQFWGALAITALGRNRPLAAIADERSSSWQGTLGASFQLLTRDTLTLQGNAAEHLVISGAINGAALDVEEYVIARDSTLILLQFRYPRGLPRDSVSLGYERALAGLDLRRPRTAQALAPAVAQPRAASPTPAPPSGGPVFEPPAAPPPPWREIWPVLGGSLWRAYRADVSVRLERDNAPASFEVRLDIVNTSPAPVSEVPLWLPHRAEPSRVTFGGAPVTTRRSGSGFVVELGDTVSFQGRGALVVSYGGPVPGAGAAAGDWLPLVQSPYDSTGLPRGPFLEEVTLRFELPEHLTAVATGRQTSELSSAGLHRQTWSATGAAARAPGYVIGRFRVGGRAADRLSLTMWSAAPDIPLDSSAALVAEAWSFNARAFGSVLPPDVHVVVGAPFTFGLPGLLLLASRDAANRGAIFREVSRTWWGGAIRATGPGSWFFERALPEWIGSRHAGGGVYAGEAASVEALRTQLGDAEFREVLRRFATEYRSEPGAAQPFLELLEPRVRLVFQEILYRIR